MSDLSDEMVKDLCGVLGCKEDDLLPLVKQMTERGTNRWLRTHGNRSDFDSVGDFHEKFGLANATHTSPKPASISAELRDFRVGFLLEELKEICEGYGLELRGTLDGFPIKDVGPGGCPDCKYNGPGYYDRTNHSCIAGVRQDLPKIADGLVDLVYVALGTAHVHGLPWPELFAEVQRANMSKRRAAKDGGDSTRGSAFDIVKPTGWRPPDIVGVLMAAGWPGPELPLVAEVDAEKAPIPVAVKSILVSQRMLSVIPSGEECDRPLWSYDSVTGAIHSYGEDPVEGHVPQLKKIQIDGRYATFEELILLLWLMPAHVQKSFRARFGEE